MKETALRISVGILIILVDSCTVRAETQISIDTIEKMPDFPQPYQMRNWNQVAANFDHIVFDPCSKGEHFPLTRIFFDKTLQKDVFAINSYVGWNVSKYESITNLNCILGSTIAGIDKSNGDINWIDWLTVFFRKDHNLNLYLNSPEATTGKTFWYEIYPNVLFYKIFSFHPDNEQMQEQFGLIAENYYSACVNLGGSISPYRLPNFNHTSYDFKSGKPYDNGLWKEPDSAASIGWLEYIAYEKLKNEKFLTASKWCMDFLKDLNENPYYEVLLPLGAYTSARMNAELDTNYDVEKLVNWCFDGSNRRGWGVTTGRWGNMDCSGLVGSVKSEEKMYGFAMNTFSQIESLLPLVRYDDRFAKDIGKWVLNAANSSRLFYSSYIDSNNQTDCEWAKKYNTNSSIAYEGLKQLYDEIDRISGEENIAGKVISGSYKSARYTNKDYEVIVEDNNGNIEHLMMAKLTPADKYVLNIVAKIDADSTDDKFMFLYASDSEGPHKYAFTFDSSNSDRQQTLPLDLKSNNLFLKLKKSGKPNNRGNRDKIFIDDIWVQSISFKSPYAGGDAKSNGWAETNLAIYGAGLVGVLGGVIETTNVEGILKLDCLKTDYFRQPAYPTYLYYNPHPESKCVEIDLGTEPAKIYNAVKNNFLTQADSGVTSFEIEPYTAILAVLTPANGQIKYKKNKTLVNDIVIDYTNALQP